MNVIEALEKEQLRQDIPDFKPGDTVRLSVRVIEGGKERIQQYEDSGNASGSGTSGQAVLSA